MLVDPIEPITDFLPTLDHRNAAVENPDDQGWALFERLKDFISHPVDSPVGSGGSNTGHPTDRGGGFGQPYGFLDREGYIHIAVGDRHIEIDGFDGRDVSDDRSARESHVDRTDRIGPKLIRRSV